MNKYTVVGINGINMQRYVEHFWGDNAEHAEQQAYWLNPDLMIGAIFEDHLVSVDIRASALIAEWQNS